MVAAFPLIPLWIFLIRPILSTFPCITHCSCIRQHGDIAANCIALNYSVVPLPELAAEAVDALYLQFNIIHRIRDGDFLLYQNLKELNMSGNRLRVIDQNAFKGLERLDTLDLSGNQIMQIPESEWFVLSSNLKWLSISLNSFNKIPRALSNFSKLTYLDVSKNVLLTDINSVHFPSTLETLDLHYTSVRIFNNYTFQHLDNLKTLHIYDNMASTSISFEEGAFDGLRSLQFIDLSRTFCSMLPRESFKMLRKLKSLIMNTCYLKEPPIFFSPVDEISLSLSQSSSQPISSTAGWYNPVLERLDLSNNRKMELRPKEKYFGPRLIDLRLGHTSLKVIDDSLLNQSSLIQTLDVSRAKLKNISSRAFANLRKISRMDLSYNELSELPQLPKSLLWIDLGGLRMKNLTKNALNQLHHLTELDFSHGHIEFIEDCTFCNTTVLITLDLSGNKITSLAKDSLRFENPEEKEKRSVLASLDLSKNRLKLIVEGSFSTLHRLKFLNLEENELEIIQPSTLSGLESLVSLKVNNNFIVDIAPGAFDDLPKLEVLDLSSNSLEVIYNGTFRNSRNLKRLLLTNNRLEIIHHENFKNLIYFDVSKNNLTIFPGIFGEFLHEVKASYNFIEIFSERAFENTKQLKKLDLSKNRLTHVNYAAFEKCKLLEELNLASNHIANFLDVRLSKLRSLTLSENDITEIGVALKSNLPSLKIIDVSNNVIAIIDPASFAGISLEYIDFSYNDLRCDCNIIPLAQWMEGHSNTLVGVGGYNCGSPESKKNMTIVAVANQLQCDSVVPRVRPAVMVAISIIIPVILLAFSIYVLMVHLSARRRAGTQTNVQLADVNDSTSRICSTCRCFGDDCTGERTLNEDQRDLMVPSPATSPCLNEPPAKI